MSVSAMEPAGRKPIKTRVLPIDRMDDVIDGVIRTIAGGKAEMTVDIADTSTVQEIATLAPALVAQIILFLASLYFFLATRHSIRDAPLAAIARSRTASMSSLRASTSE